MPPSHRELACRLAAFMRRAGMAMLLGAATTSAPEASAQVHIDSAPGIEAGAPPFVAIGVETLGLTAPPTSLTRLPDGRFLLTAPRQLALGDGVRWQVLHQADDDPAEAGLGPAVDQDGTLYVGTAEGAARVEFSREGTWHLVREAAWGETVNAAITLPQATVNDLGDTWLWHSLTGAVIAWKPGSTPLVLSTANVVEHAFRLGGESYLSERFGGRLTRLRDGRSEVVLQSGTLGAITCTAPFAPGVVLAGTYASGLKLFDGTGVRPFPAGTLLATGARIQDICATEGDFFAVAVDNFGVVFISRDGRVVQTLDRTVDSRLTRVKRLLPTADGAVWALVDAGLVRIAFPNPVSYFEPYIGPGVTTVHPRRIDGGLWMLADGRLHRAVYDDGGRMAGLELDSPPHTFVNSFSDAMGPLVAGTEDGAWIRPRDEPGWTKFADDVTSLHILDPRPVSGRWLYAALGEVGWLERTATGIRIGERRPAPGLTNIFNRPLHDRHGRIWFELGTGRVGRVHLDSGIPVVTVLDESDGLPPRWPQAFLLEGEIRVNFADTVHRFDDASRRFVPDEEFPAGLPGVDQTYGRAGSGPDGRLWVTTGPVVRVFSRQAGAWREAGRPVRPGFQPYYFTFEASGVVWMHAQHHFARYDPAMPLPQIPESVATITHVSIPGRNLHFFSPGETLPDLASAENSLIVHFATRVESFAAPVTFDVRLEGRGGDWINAGSSGSAVFNDLKPGRHILHVRPVSQGVRGASDTVAFTILPPWYLTTHAYFAAVVALIAIVTAVARAWSYMARRERQRLERLVAERTADLQASEERYRHLSHELEQRVDARTRELHRTNQRLNETNRELEAFSYSVSHDLRAPLRGIDGWSHALLDDFGETLNPTARGYLDRVRSEAQRLGHLIDDLLTLSRTTRAEFHPVPVDLSGLAATIARRIADMRQDRPVEFICQPGLQVHGDPVLLESALTNLLDNAWKFTGHTPSPRVEFGRADTESGPAYFVRDNGAGFDLRHARKLFGVFQRMHAQDEFPGTGVGLATVQRIVHRHGGRIWADASPGLGATFFFTLPETPPFEVSPQGEPHGPPE